jgi:hypothetical protein
MRKRIQRLAVLIVSLSLTIGVSGAVAAQPDVTGGGPEKGKPQDPGSQGKGKSKANAARACKAERADIGVDAFREKYGTGPNGRNAFGKCVSSQRKSQEDGGSEDPVAT